ncbi:MAG: HipA domain-containing protein [Suipraeoptans sp.]
MKCLYCGKSINGTASEDELASEWHQRCVKEFFGTSNMPRIEISDAQIEDIARLYVEKGYTVTGVQKKLSLHLTDEKETRLTIVDYPTGYILKPQTEEFEGLPEAEALCMRLAKVTGIAVVDFGLIKMNSETRKLAYITKRIDRKSTNEKDKRIVQEFAMEDFCQLTNRLTQDKYRGSYERCIEVVRKYSNRLGLDMSEIFMRIVFFYVTGNSDMHLKNFSMIENEPGSREFALSKAYDLLPVNVVMPEDNEELALTLNGKKRNITKRDFLRLAKKCELP